MEDQDYWTVNAMELYGGSFVVALARAVRAADHINLAKIKETWPEYWEQYEKMGVKLKEDA